MYTVALSKVSFKYLKKLPLYKAEQVINVLEDLRRDPVASSIKLHGKLKNLRRAKASDLRIIFELNVDKRQIFVRAIGPRGNIYK